jgi:hypothetical protein
LAYSYYQFSYLREKSIKENKRDSGKAAMEIEREIDPLTLKLQRTQARAGKRQARQNNSVGRQGFVSLSLCAKKQKEKEKQKEFFPEN